LKLPPEDVAFLISADLFACGLATLVQCTPASDDGRHLCVVFGILAALCVRSRWVTVAGGGIMLLPGLLPKMAALVEAVRSRCLAAPAS
jgi:xanthine/uracil permease